MVYLLMNLFKFDNHFLFLQFKNMPWYMNFCAPFMPNDPTINFHRSFQVALLAAYTLIYGLIHIYYMFWGPLPITHKEQSVAHQRPQEDMSQNSSNMSDNKELSIKLEEHANDSCIQLKKTGTTWNSSDGQPTTSIVENVTLQEMEQYHSIVYGHFAVAVGFSTMYTPYAEQSGAALTYIILTIPMMIANAYRWEKTVRICWIVMAMSLMFLFTSGLLQVGQSNWDVLNLNCFANLYTSFYS